MATFFGEILPVTSRAVDDDDEDDDLEPPDCILSMRWSDQAKVDMKKSGNGKLECDTLIIAIGPAPTGFARAYILHEEDKFDLIGGIFGGIKEQHFNTFQQTSPTDKTCYLYRNTDNPRVMLCQCNVDITPEQSYSFTSQLFAGIDLRLAYISILCSASTSDFKCDVPILDMQPPFLRALKTTKFAGTPLCPYLEQPNVIAGLPAQLLSTCQIHGYKAVLYCCYTETIYLSSAMMKTYLPLLNSTPIKDILHKNPHADAMLKKIVALHTNHNTLYL